MIACFLSNISAKYYKNPSMLSRVIAKNDGNVFLRPSVVSDIRFDLTIAVLDKVGLREMRTSSHSSHFTHVSVYLILDVDGLCSRSA